MKLEKISNNVLYAVCAVIVLVFILFFTVGHDQYDEKGNVAPAMTDVLLCLQYLLGLFTLCLMGWSLVKGAMSSGGNDEKATTGVPGKMIVFVTAIITLLSWVVGFVLNLGEEPVVKNNDVLASSTMVTVTDAFMFSIYVLALVSVVAVVVSATGIMTKTATKR